MPINVRAEIRLSGMVENRTDIVFMRIFHVPIYTITTVTHIIDCNSYHSILCDRVTVNIVFDYFGNFNDTVITSFFSQKYCTYPIFVGISYKTKLKCYSYKNYDYFINESKYFSLVFIDCDRIFNVVELHM